MATLARRTTASYGTALVTSAGLDALAAVWLFVSAFLLNHDGSGFFVNNLTFGAIAAILAFGAFAHVWLASLPAAIGAWVMISPFVLGFSHNTPGTVSNVLTGAVILGVAIRSWAVAKSARDAGVMTD